jgi:hypothetical protein
MYLPVKLVYISAFELNALSLSLLLMTMDLSQFLQICPHKMPYRSIKNKELARFIFKLWTLQNSSSTQYRISHSVA